MPQIDQSNFVATDIKHVWLDSITNKFFFTDETSEAHGPFDSIEVAQVQLEVYAAGLQHGPDIAEGLAALLGGDDLVDILQKMQQSKWPLLTAAEKDAKTNELLEKVLADVKAGFELNSSDFETEFDALQFFSAQVASATIKELQSRDHLGQALTETAFSVRTMDECLYVLTEYFIGQCFCEDDKVEGSYRFSEAAAKHVEETTIKPFKEIHLQNQMPETDEEISPVQKEAAHKIGVFMQNLTKRIVQKHGAAAGEYLIGYADRIRFTLLSQMPAAERMTQINNGYMEPLQDPMSAVKWLTNHLSKIVIKRDKSVEDGPSQPWNWDTEGEAIANRLLEECA